VIDVRPQAIGTRNGDEKVIDVRPQVIGRRKIRKLGN